MFISGRIPKRGRKKRDMRDERKYLKDPSFTYSSSCPTITSRPNLKDVKPLKVAQQHCPTRPAPSAIERDALAFYYVPINSTKLWIEKHPKSKEENNTYCFIKLPNTSKSIRCQQKNNIQSTKGIKRTRVTDEFCQAKNLLQ